MRNVLMLTALLVSSQANAWLEPFSPYGMMPYGGFGYGGYGYGMGGYIPFIPGPSFSYNTTVIQQPAPIIVQQPPQQVIYKEVEVCNSECERLRGYFGKR
jgi:hypothetical protein|nr:MAG: hypothetical protein [Caudoviricetes sp.]